MEKRRYKLIRKIVMVAVVVLLVSGGLFGGYRALTRATSDLRPL